MAAGKGHGLGPPRGRAAATPVEELAKALNNKPDLDPSMQWALQSFAGFLEQLEQPCGVTFIAE
eukprot:4590333-Pyramimonas_sp.AAC.1